MDPTSFRALFLANEHGRCTARARSTRFLKKSLNEVEKKEEVRSQAALEVKLELWSGISGEQLRIELPTT